MKIGAIATLVNHISLRVSVKYKLLEFWISVGHQVLEVVVRSVSEPAMSCTRLLNDIQQEAFAI